MNNATAIAVVGVIAVLVGGATWYFVSKDDEQPAAPPPPPPPAVERAPRGSATADAMGIIGALAQAGVAIAGAARGS